MKKMSKILISATVLVLLLLVFTACVGGGIPSGKYYAYQGGEKVDGVYVSVSKGLNGTDNCTIVNKGTQVPLTIKDGGLFKNDESVGSISYNKKSKTLSVSHSLAGGYTFKKE